MLDYVVADYNDLMGRLGTDDRAKLDQHLTNIRDIETRSAADRQPGDRQLPGGGRIMPTSPPRQQCLRDQDLRDADRAREQAPNFCVTNFREIGKLQMDLMVLALTCDLTRVASLQWSTAESTVIHEWLPLEYTGTREHHMMTHNESVAVSVMAAKVDQATATTIRSDLTKIHNWYAQQFAYMLGKLKAVQEGGKTLLDNMLLFWTNELGIGGTHSYTNVPYGAGRELRRPGADRPLHRLHRRRDARLRRRPGPQQAVRDVHEPARDQRERLRPRPPVPDVLGPVPGLV